LQADEPAPERRGENLRDLGLADARLAFQEERPPELERQEQHRGERPVGDVAGAFQELEGIVDRLRQGGQSGGLREGRLFTEG
jgi:hypothetical protein